MLENEIFTVGSSIVYAIISAVFYALLGYAKRSNGDEVFDGERMLVTVVVGIIAGLFSYWMSIPPEQAVQLVLADVGLVYLIENIVKAIWRRWFLPAVKVKSK